MAMASLARRKACLLTRNIPTAPLRFSFSLSRGFASSGSDENDVVIIGGGPGGYVAAIKAAQLGLKTTCIEKRGALGGTCLNVGCIPSKALLHSSHMYHEAKHVFANHGVKVSSVEVDLPAMLAQKDTAVKNLTRGIEGLFKKNKVNYVKGYGKFLSPSEVSVETSDGENTVVKGKHIIVATGSDVKSLPGITIDEKKIVSSTGALSLSEIPKKLIVIGAGYIGLEMGSVWGRLGSEVTVVEFASDIVPSMDGEIRKQFQRTLEKQKMKFMLKTKVVGVDSSGDGVKLIVEPAEGGDQSTLEADVVLVSAGRSPFTSGLDLEKIGVEKYGTHVITGVSVGGQDVVVVRQDKSSDLGTDLLRHHLYDLGDQLFTGTCLISSHRPNKAHHHSQSQPKFPEAFNVFDDKQTVAFNNFSINSKDGITVICAKRGGDGRAKSHSEWLITVPDKPDAINFNFIPITSLLKDVPGCGLLSHAISLYLRYKPPLMDLQYFLEFSGPRTWAPIHNDLPFGAAPNMASAYPSLHINFLGPKLYVNTTPVTSEKNPVTGMRFFLEGKKCNRLAIHLQHLENTRTTVSEKITDDHIWRGSDEISDSNRYFEPLNGKKFSHVCTAPVKYDPNWITTTTNKNSNDNVAYIVTGAQLEVKKHGSKSVLHLRLRFTGVSDHHVVQKEWVHGPGTSKKSGIFSTMSLPLTGGSVHHNMVDNKDRNEVVLDSGVFPRGPPVPANNKIVKFVDLSQLCRGPQHSPGHWLVTGARLYLEKGKLNVHVKFALLHRQRLPAPS